jgi:pimeloyl-ACP methyl ester carboxylesterase
MKKKILIIILIGITFVINSQSIMGTWNGVLNANKQLIPLVFHIHDSLATSVSMDSPEQHAYGIKAETSSFQNDSLHLSIKSLGASMIGYHDADKDSIFMDFKQMGVKGKLVLGRGDYVKEKPVRTQDPVDFPYYVEEISIPSVEGVTLAGTLTMPNFCTNKESVNKIVVLISGSGAQDRNEEIFDHRPFLVLSDYLTRNGISVIRYDDRGTAESTGDFANSTTYDFSLDVEAVVNYIKNRDDLKEMSIGLIGHSEGGMIAPMVATRNLHVDFIVLLAAPGIPVSELMIHQNMDIMNAAKAPKEVISLEIKSLKEIYTVLKNNKLDQNTQLEKVISIKEKTYKKYPKGMINKDDIKQMSESRAKPYFSTWMYYFCTFNPQEYLSKITIPVLALNGEKDIQVRAKENLEGIEKSLKKADNQNYTVVNLPNLNHLFQKCLFGSTNFYATNKETFNEEAMRRIAEWIND